MAHMFSSMKWKGLFPEKLGFVEFFAFSTYLYEGTRELFKLGFGSVVEVFASILKAWVQLLQPMSSAEFRVA